MARDHKDLISIESPKTDFEKFLSADNKRIFFSGPFGIGKTFFLQNFFKEHPRAREYDVYHLFPVNYQISSNENIIEFLKYDILVELLNKHPNAFERNELGGLTENVKLFIAFCIDRGLISHLSKSAFQASISTLGSVPDPLFQLIGLLGRSLSELTELVERFKGFKKEHINKDQSTIDSFLKEVKTKKDVVATDYISHLIHEKIKHLKENRQSVLILDDFDRIDPEHTFRILNVLSAHHTEIEISDNNKFGFDHIIIVGDRNNLHNIFRHKYGEETDFWGYFDKFFSVRPFEFDNEKAVAESIPQLMQRIKKNPSLKGALGKGGIIKRLLEEVLGKALAAKKMNLRQLYRPLDHPFPEVNYGVYSPKGFYEGMNQRINIGIKLLIAIYGGDVEHFGGVLHQIKESSPYIAPQEKLWLYGFYANSMLKRMITPRTTRKKLWLNKYMLEEIPYSKGQPTIIYIYPKGGAHTRFFYDTLIEYVKQSKYKQDP